MLIRESLRVLEHFQNEFHKVCIKVALSFQINQLPKKKYFKKLACMYHNECFLWRKVWKKKHHNIGFPTFKFPSSTKNLLWLTH